MKAKQVIVSWSGGKDSCLALYKALKLGFKPIYLLNIATDTKKGFRVHGLDPRIIVDQAETLGIPIIQRNASWSSYEQVFKEAINEIKSRMRVDGIIFGDIFIEEHRKWTQRVCEKLGLESFSPLFGEDEKELMTEFLNAGFKAMIVCIMAGKLSENFLGRVLDWNLLTILEEAEIDLCGEHGEYHTLVLDGPIFKKKIEIIDSRITALKPNHIVLDVNSWRLVEKNQ